MRKVSPKVVKKDFLEQLTNLEAFHTTGLTVFTKKSDQSTLTEHSLLTAAVIWEGFLSEMFIAYINDDASRYKKHLEDSLQKHLNSSPKAKRIFDDFGYLILPSHMTKAVVISHTDSMGNNITFSNFEKLEEKAKKWLVTKHADKFKRLTKEQQAVFNSLIALRNHIAHRSQRSLDAMNKALAHGALHPTGLKRLNNRFHNVGAWLKATPSGHTEPRLTIIFRKLRDFAAQI